MANGESPQDLITMIRWQNVWLRIIARAWEDKEFFEEITTANPEETAGLVKRYFNYDVPAHLALQIKPTTVGPDDPYRYDDDFERIELTVHIPPTPKQGREAVALAAYSDRGQTYPFTCF
jgi:ribosomally synthesized peptide (two-chain TOMM family)